MTNKDNVSLELAKRLTDMVTAEFDSGQMYGKVTPTTAELLKYWFSTEYCETRKMNFHQGQRQAILNIIYLHEVMGVDDVMDIYKCVAEDLLQTADLGQLAQQKYQMPKYAVKMATGTGKTWVMHALFLWQMLNARHEDMPSGRFTKNFLIVAPGLIVYDRLKDAFCGRIKRGEEQRNLETNDFYYNKELFIPLHYRQEVFSFIQNNVVTKEDGIGRKTTGDGMIALTNWHLFENQIDDVETSDNGDLVLTPPEIIGSLLPVRPGKAAGNDLGALDRRALRGNEINYLASLSDLMVINDEAHHIHEIRKNGETEEVEWQKGLNKISEDKSNRFIQVDFSATPYDTIGSGKNMVKSYFPHIVVDFDLAQAMRQGLVKTLLLDRRAELTDLEDLDYKAERDERGKVIGLSDGQRLMLRAGLTKLRKLENDFVKTDTNKNPKMLIMCEDTNVSPYVEQFMLDEGLSGDDLLKIDSNQKGEVGEEEWKAVKAKLFDIDRYKTPKVIISVLMLREGFDVNNICVIVPLRSSQSQILLEQIIGRGLRLMWRESDYDSIKAEDRKRVMVLHKDPVTYIDMLSIIEHPAFIQFYDEMFANNLVAIDSGDVGGESSVGDIINVGLKDGFESYDFEWPIIIRDAEENIADAQIDPMDMQPFTMFPIETLRKFLADEGETFVAQEVLTKTSFGKYKVTGNLFTAKSYNEYLQKILHIITERFDGVSRGKGMPSIQVNTAVIIGAVDVYIRTRLFDQPFNPFTGFDWKILLAKNGVVTQHIIKEVAVAIYKMQNNITVTEAQVEHVKFSSVQVLKMRENYSQELQKTIYERTGWPSNRGGFEKSFEEFLDKDSEVERFLKINETQHTFAILYYIRFDGLMATYHPDFIVGTKERIYLIETKGNDKINDRNVRQKQTATIEWTRRINALPAKERMDREWEYVLISEDNFYGLYSNGASITDICDRCKVSMSAATGNLFA
jgi:type III restriction enzyme